ncbi:hypothetical protein [Budvicia aquatica]|uniref:Uncharacterized protein n=1 Tax=Budvicia aquatica TaxID=82979 RepID=A0A2C6CX90_9GAMM|nr:hypothetical protein [Budvicia aquatica]PHI31299.1 hypothetical protein CRN84_19120 [Budvicia aquatica]VFS51601.1 Uncharacterised protein [Budvicia aquatica]
MNKICYVVQNLTRCIGQIAPGLSKCKDQSVTKNAFWSLYSLISFPALPAGFSVNANIGSDHGALHGSNNISNQPDTLPINNIDKTDISGFYGAVFVIPSIDYSDQVKLNLFSDSRVKTVTPNFSDYRFDTERTYGYSSYRILFCLNRRITVERYFCLF